MQFDDPKSILERAAAKPSRAVDAVAMIERGRRLRRLRAASAVVGLAVVVAGASASLGLRGEPFGGDVAGVPACNAGRYATVLLRLDASESDVSALEVRLGSMPGVLSVAHFSSRELAEDLAPAYGQSADLEPLPAGYLTVEGADAEVIDRVRQVESDAIDWVTRGPERDPACIAELCEYRPPPSASIFLRDDVRRKDTRTLRRQLLDTRNIESVVYFSRREAYEEFRDLYRDQPFLYETGPPRNFPASLRVGASTNAAVERLHALRLPIVDEVRSTARGPCAELAPPPTESKVYEGLTRPDETLPIDDAQEGMEAGPPTDLIATLRAAECRLDPPASIEGEPDPSVKWCSFEVEIENVSSDPLHFDWDARLLLVGDGEERAYSTAMFTGRLSPRRIDLVIASRERVIQDLHFEVDADEIPIDLTIPYEGGRVAFELNYDCARDLREEPYGRCEFEER